MLVDSCLAYIGVPRPSGETLGLLTQLTRDWDEVAHDALSSNAGPRYVLLLLLGDDEASGAMFDYLSKYCRQIDSITGNNLLLIAPNVPLALGGDSKQGVQAEAYLVERGCKSVFTRQSAPTREQQVSTAYEIVNEFTDDPDGILTLPALVFLHFADDGPMKGRGIRLALPHDDAGREGLMRNLGRLADKGVTEETAAEDFRDLALYHPTRGLYLQEIRNIAGRSLRGFLALIKEKLLKT